MADSQAGFPSRELGTDPIIKRAGSNQIVRGNRHDGQDTRGPRANKVQSGQTPRTSGPAIGAPDAVNPLGRNSTTSLNG